MQKDRKGNKGPVIVERWRRAGANRGRVNNFYAGRKGSHINLCTHIRELCYTKGCKGGGSTKNVLHKGEGQL